MSQIQAAEKLGVSRQTIGRWEQGVSSPSMENLIALSELYGVPIDALVKDDWVPPEEKPPEVQVVEIPVEIPVEVPVPVEVPCPRNYRLWALLAVSIHMAHHIMPDQFFPLFCHLIVDILCMAFQFINLFLRNHRPSILA